MSERFDKKQLGLGVQPQNASSTKKCAAVVEFLGALSRPLTSMTQSLQREIVPPAARLCSDVPPLEKWGSLCSVDRKIDIFGTRV